MLIQTFLEKTKLLIRRQKLLLEFAKTKPFLDPSKLNLIKELSSIFYWKNTFIGFFTKISRIYVYLRVS